MFFFCILYLLEVNIQSKATKKSFISNKNPNIIKGWVLNPARQQLTDHLKMVAAVTAVSQDIGSFLSATVNLIREAAKKLFVSGPTTKKGGEEKKTFF